MLHRQRPLRGFGDEAVERTRRLDRANVFFRQCGRRDFALAQCVASLGDRQIRRLRHHSTTFGTVKKPCAASGALASTFSGYRPSTTSSLRRGRTASTTEVTGGTPSVFTSPSHSAQPKIFDTPLQIRKPSSREQGVHS